MHGEPEIKKSNLGKILNGQDSHPEPARTAKTAISTKTTTSASA